MQPGCERLTTDWYRVDLRTANTVRGAVAGYTCAACYEALVRRSTREQVHHRAPSILRDERADEC